MKTFRIILSIAGIALTSISFGQLLSQSDEGILFYKVAYNSINDRLEHHLEEYPDKRAYGDHFESSLASRTYFAPMETDLVVEEWMTTPFESNYFEVEPFIESWMISPFDCDYYEVDPFIESWMMSPFESNYYEVDPIIESWMTRPFIMDEDIEVEAWMTTSWM